MNNWSNAGKWIRRMLITAAVVLLILYFGFILPFRGVPFNAKRHGNPPVTPPWALECWLWEDDHNTSEYADSLLAGYARYDIPVRTILLDSPWSTRYNDFDVDTVLYPKPEEWFGRLQKNGYRVVLWMTSMVNSYSKDTRFAESGNWSKEAAEKGYLAGGDDQVSWWKGRGGFIDYTNPAAMKWWRGMQNKVFEYGIDGWKLDGTGTLFRSQLGPIPLLYKSTSAGVMMTRTYMDHYYRGEYNYGLTRNPEFVTLARAIDRWYHPEGFAPIDAAPVTWVGDQKHTWESAGGISANDKQPDIAMKGIDGIEMAIKNILESASLGYNIIGSDVAGFSGKDIPPRLYIRWAQFSAFCGLFLNGGHGERALWKRSLQELEIIRRFSWLHTELVPYMYTYVVNGSKGEEVLQRPMKKNYQYMFGDDFLITPVYKDQLTREIIFPKGRWRYFFDDKQVVEGPAKVNKEFPLEEFPVYIRDGAIIPMDVKRDYTGLGDKSSEGYLTILIYPYGKNSFTVHHPDKSGSTVIDVTEDNEMIVISLGNVHKPHILRVNINSKPKKVELDNVVLSDTTDYLFDKDRNKLIIKTNSYRNGVYNIYK
jgi:alpha-glucosidase (family GH31 glycosyl hydrolase)